MEQEKERYRRSARFSVSNCLIIIIPFSERKCAIVGGCEEVENRQKASIHLAFSQLILLYRNACFLFSTSLRSTQNVCVCVFVVENTTAFIKIYLSFVIFIYLFV